jgi:hypothetical protein
MHMQLATPEVIETLLTRAALPERGSRRRVPGDFTSRSARVYKSLGCSRGCTCRRCSDNARWERIFQEKFADPDYYSNPITRNGSSLSDC